MSPAPAACTHWKQPTAAEQLQQLVPRGNSQQPPSSCSILRPVEIVSRAGHTDSKSLILQLICFFRASLVQWIPVERAQLVSCRFQPSQPQRITSGLKANFSLSPSYSFHKILDHKSLFLKPQLKFYPQFRNVNPEKQ